MRENAWKCTGVLWFCCICKKWKKPKSFQSMCKATRTWGALQLYWGDSGGCGQSEARGPHVPLRKKTPELLTHSPWHATAALHRWTGRNVCESSRGSKKMFSVKSYQLLISSLNKISYPVQILELALLIDLMWVIV